jgi:hypothetical protein
MSLLAEALQPQLVRELLNLRGRAQACHLSDIYVSSPKTGFDLDFDDAEQSILIDFRERSFLASAVAGDACRFSQAAFLTAAAVEQRITGREDTAWSLIKLYYSAFYAGHAVLRVLGSSCSQLDNGHINKIRRAADARGCVAPFPLQAGLYHCILNPQQSGVKMLQLAGRNGGSHEIFWGVLDSFLSQAAEEIVSGHLGPEDSRQVFGKIEAFRRALGRRGSGSSWLSSVRNEVQYRHDRGVWVPQSISESTRTALGRLASQWRRDPIEIDLEVPPCGELGLFVSAAAFIISMAKALFERIADRSSAGHSSFARLPLQLCR